MFCPLLFFKLVSSCRIEALNVVGQPVTERVSERTTPVAQGLCRAQREMAGERVGCITLSQQLLGHEAWTHDYRLVGHVPVHAGFLNMKAPFANGLASVLNLENCLDLSQKLAKFRSLRMTQNVGFRKPES